MVFLIENILHKNLFYARSIFMLSAHFNIHIRTVPVSNADVLLTIYAPYVHETSITFKYKLPST